MPAFRTLQHPVTVTPPPRTPHGCNRQGRGIATALDVRYPHEYIRRVLTVLQTEEFVAWLDALNDRRAQLRITACLRQPWRLVAD